MLCGQSMLLIISCMHETFMIHSHIAAFEKNLGVVGLVAHTKVSELRTIIIVCNLLHNGL